MRYSTHTYSGITLPDALRGREIKDMRRAASLVFFAACAWATDAAQEETATAIGAVIGTAGKREKARRAEIAATWVTVLHLLEKLLRDDAKELGAKPPTVAVADAWASFLALAGWRLRDINTVRSESFDEIPTEDGPTKIDISRRPPTSAPSEMPKALKAFQDARVDNKGKDGPEAQHPIHALAGRIVGLSATTDVPQFIRGAATDLANVIDLPLDTRLAITLSFLLRLREDHRPSIAYLDGLDDWFRLLVQRAHRRALADAASTWTDDDKCAFSSAVRDLLPQALGYDVLIAMPNTSARLQEILDSLTSMPKPSDDDTLKVASLAADALFDETSHEKLVAPALDALLAILLEIGFDESHCRRYVERKKKDRKNSDDGRSIFNMLMRAAPEATQLAAAAAPDDPAWVNDLAATLCTSRGPFIAQKYDVAVPIANYEIADGKESDAGGEIAAFDTLYTAWFPPQPAAFKRTFGPALARQACLIVRDVVASSWAEAEARARVRAEGELNLYWFLERKDRPLVLDNTRAILRAHTGEVKMPQRRFTWMQTWPQASLAPISGRIVEIRASSSHPDQQALFARLASGLGHFQHAQSAQTSHERVLGMWVALESLVTNLGVDALMPPNAATIGSSVAFRTALLLPSRGTPGQTHGAARWGTALELDGIYWVRNRIVHKGHRNPAVDDILLDRLESILAGAYMQMVLNALRHQDLTSVEEMLAWREHVEPNATVIPSPPPPPPPRPPST